MRVRDSRSEEILRSRRRGFRYQVVIAHDKRAISSRGRRSRRKLDLLEKRDSRTNRNTEQSRSDQKDRQNRDRGSNRQTDRIRHRHTKSEI